MIEPEKPLKKKDHIKLDEEVALKLKAQFEEEARLERERAKKEAAEANVALTKEWDDIQAKVKTDYELAARLSALEQDELTIAKRAEEKRNKPPIKTQQRKIMCTYLKNMKGYQMNYFKGKDFGTIQKMFDKAFKRVNMFEDFRTKLVKGSKTRAEGSEKVEGKQEVNDKQETAKLNECLEVVPEEIGIDVVPLAVKSLIVDWKIYKEGKKGYYQIIRAFGNSEMYMIFSEMLKRFDKEDLNVLYKLVMDKYGSTKPVEDLDLLL
ncbi:hypothetical protein Tco_0692363 [Tanacetum coccineum]